MGITEFSKRRARSKVHYLWPDIPAEALRVLELNGYEPVAYDEAVLSDPVALAQTDSFLIVQIKDKPTRIYAQLEKICSAALPHDCRVYVHPVPLAEDVDRLRMRKVLVNSLDSLKLRAAGLTADEESRMGRWLGGPSLAPLSPAVYLVERAGDWAALCSVMHLNPAGVAPNFNLVIEARNVRGELVDLPEEEKIVLRRAFANCSVLKMVEMQNGLSGVAAYRAHAELAQGVLGKWPYEFFVKVGGPENDGWLKIIREFRKYEANALEYVPFHLGPRLRRERCALGHRTGVIAGDFVVGAESLKNAARDGRATAAIHNLFSKTISVWQRTQVSSGEKSLQQYLHSRFPIAVPGHREGLITAGGATRDLIALRALFDTDPSKPVLCGVVHGDLHATNVLVRGQDAVIIDFERMENDMPLLFDAASLEGGLFVDGFIGDRRTGVELLKSLQPLYTRKALQGDFNPCHPQDDSQWFFDCVRPIRMQARELERAPLQYALCLAAILLKKSCNDEDFSKEATNPRALPRQEVRALAYVLAESILVAITSSPP